MFKKAFLLYLIFASWNPALADCKKCTMDFDISNYPQTYDGKAIIPHPRVTYEDSSEVYRHKKMFYLQASAGLIAYQVSASYFLNPDTLLDANFLYQKDSVAGISRLYSLSASRFVSDTLYFRAGPAFRVGDIINYINTYGKTGPSVDRSKDYGLEFGVGNRWQWRNLSLGGEWFALYLPVITDPNTAFDFQFRILMMQLGVAF